MIKHTAKRRAFAQRPCPIRITPFHKRVANRRFCNSAAFMIAQGKNGVKTQIGSITAVRGEPRAAVFVRGRGPSADGADVVDGQQQSGAFAVALGAEQALVGADVGGKGAHAAGEPFLPDEFVRF